MHKFDRRGSLLAESPGRVFSEILGKLERPGGELTGVDAGFWLSGPLDGGVPAMGRRRLVPLMTDGEVL